ncbi:hypothetical protein SUGI_0561220 [Cryptomeria japonica]|uniref:homeobox-leucine zipper protein HOX27-like n=1 Tax=Cryptomeria japonica TaxID=3369 RepID=UPI002408B787|nr:homeobox-leucine zipper protein HOX27-like [Cryptomeria japonica]GLJ28524.1 hypothetical protein SUGI_0561220 [Cryptomeria japonica]
MEVGNVNCDEGVQHSASTDLGFQNGAPASPPPFSKLDLLPQAPLNHASASLAPLPGTQDLANEKSDVCSQNSLDLNKSPASDGQDDLQKDLNVENGSLTITNEKEKDGIKRRLRLSGEQYAYLEECFKQNTKVDNIRKEALAKELNISPRQVYVWFQNRKARNKQNEKHGKPWKSHYKALRQENKRLRKELAEIKTLKQAQETPSVVK